ncbi:MAG TPA: hypothetical protein VEI46_10540 [Thermodesulfovibrionales bacterium]|nr:hypothetical protein [Thermodesulfovibrionales bacterium]
MKFISVIAILLSLAAGIIYSWAQGTTYSINLPEARVELKPGEALTKVETFCNICHSLDYIIMQPKFTKPQWTATVSKMIKVFGAPISEEDERLIVNYLVAQYGARN